MENSTIQTINLTVQDAAAPLPPDTSGETEGTIGSGNYGAMLGQGGTAAVSILGAFLFAVLVAGIIIFKKHKTRKTAFRGFRHKRHRFGMAAAAFATVVTVGALVTGAYMSTQATTGEAEVSVDPETVSLSLAQGSSETVQSKIMVTLPGGTPQEVDAKLTVGIDDAVETGEYTYEVAYSLGIDREAGFVWQLTAVAEKEDDGVMISVCKTDSYLCEEISGASTPIDTFNPIIPISMQQFGDMDYCPEMPAFDSANPEETTLMLVDARDNRTYNVRKLTRDRCWMVTNLAYNGGGNNANGDAMSLAGVKRQADNDSGYWSGSLAGDFQEPYYAIPQSPGANNLGRSLWPNAPSTASGAENGAQFGNLYNWCAAMGGQPGACTDSTTIIQTDVDDTISICPSGWTLPGTWAWTTTPTSNNFEDLITALGGGNTQAMDAGFLNGFLPVFAGFYDAWTTTAGFWGESDNVYTGYWSNRVRSGVPQADALFINNAVNDRAILLGNNHARRFGFAVRCVSEN